jgi:hypothetical protein
MSATRDAALGFSVHTGWAAMVAIVGPLSKPEVVDRQRVQLIESAEDMARFVYHNAAELDISAARRLVNTTCKSVRKATLTALLAAIQDLRRRGIQVTRAGVIGTAPGLPTTLEAILKSHAAIHAAEGNLYRGAITTACETLGLTVSYGTPDDMTRSTAARVRMTAGTLDAYISGLKKQVGPPWGLDQKQAMIAAWSALVAAPPGKPARSKSRSRARGMR